VNLVCQSVIHKSSFLLSWRFTLLSAEISSIFSVSCKVKSLTNSCILFCVDGPVRLERNDLSSLMRPTALLRSALRSISASSLSEYSYIMYLYSLICISFSSKSSFIEMFSVASISNVEVGTKAAASCSSGVAQSDPVKIIVDLRSSIASYSNSLRFSGPTRSKVNSPRRSGTSTEFSSSLSLREMVLGLGECSADPASSWSARRYCIISS